MTNLGGGLRGGEVAVDSMISSYRSSCGSTIPTSAFSHSPPSSASYRPYHRPALSASPWRRAVTDEGGKESTRFKLPYATHQASFLSSSSALPERIKDGEGSSSSSTSSNTRRRSSRMMMNMNRTPSSARSPFSSSSPSSPSSSAAAAAEARRLPTTTTTSTRTKTRPTTSSSASSSFQPYWGAVASRSFFSSFLALLTSLSISPFSRTSSSSAWAIEGGRSPVNLEYVQQRSLLQQQKGEITGIEESLNNRGIDYSCLFGQCGKELGAALLDPRGMHEVACLVTCGQNDLPCQMKCGDIYKEDVLRKFHTCAISKHQCVPQRVEAAPLKVPDPSILVPSLSLPDLSGEWYITHGLNPIFDCYSCQHHQAFVDLEGSKGGRGSTSPSISFDVSYEVPNDRPLQAFERNLRQTFHQDPKLPGLLHARDDDYLQQEDDWYILAADPSSYMFVYYTGCNKAWCGYTGGVVYSRKPQLDPSALDTIREAAKRAGIAYEGMCPTDNTCSINRKGLSASSSSSSSTVSSSSSSSLSASTR